MDKFIKNSKKLKNYSRIPHKYKFLNVDNYNKLKPLTYTILVKDTELITNIKGKIENNQKLQRGDYVLCGKDNEKYGLKLEKIIDLFNLGIMEQKPISRKGFKLSKKNMNNMNLKGNKITINPSWGGEQYLKQNDYILLEKDKSGYYGIEESAFKKTYK